jgi:hypothetical protein
MRQLLIITGCAFLCCAGCGSVHVNPLGTETISVARCVEQLVAGRAPKAKAGFKPGPVFTVAVTERAFEDVGLRLRPMSVRFSWKKLGIRPYPKAAFNPAFSKDHSKPPVSIIVAVYRNVFAASVASRRYGPNVRGSCDTHSRVGNVLFVWSGHEDRRLRTVIARLR